MTSPRNGAPTYEPWTSAVIPPWTLADNGATTPGGSPAVFRSSTHAWIALRLVYLAEVAGQAPSKVRGKAAVYRQHWDRYLQFLEDMRAIVALLDDDLEVASERWNSIDQSCANSAITSMFCEREPFPTVNLATVAQRHFGLAPTNSDALDDIDRKSNDSDNEAAWRAATDGRCRSCGSPTISQHQYDRLRTIMRSNPDLFDLTPSYTQTSGAQAPLWSERLLIAAKGVADHIQPRSRGGRTSPENLANVCAACNYSRNDASLDAVRVAAYSRHANLGSAIVPR